MALPINIEDLINFRTVESVRIEFKEGWNPEDTIHTICAFANDINDYGGGYLVIGIEEQDGIPVLPPKGLQQNQVDAIQKKLLELFNIIQPNIFPVVEPVLFQGRDIIIVWVTTGEQRPYNAPQSLGKKGKERRIYVRPSSATVIASPVLEQQLREISAVKHFDDRVNQNATLADIDLELILSYLQTIKSDLFDQASKISIEELCQKMQIVRGPKENVKLLNVALLLFCKHPEKYFPGCVTNLVEFEDEAGTKYSDKQFKGPVHIQIKQIMEYLNANIIKNFTKKTSNAAESNYFYNYPYQAIEEMIANAFHHRSYEDEHPNEIRVYKNNSEKTSSDNRRIEILSYPGPLPPVDENALANLSIKARNYRNIKLGDWLKHIKLVEKYATGIPTLVKSLDNNGSPSPILSTDIARSHFLVVIKIHPDVPESLSSNISEVINISLSNNQQSILDSIANEPKIQVELTNLFGEHVDKEIDFLLENELIKNKPITNNNLYFITRKGIEALKQSF